MIKCKLLIYIYYLCKGVMSKKGTSVMKIIKKIGQILAICAIFCLMLVLIYKIEGRELTVSEAASAYPESMVESMQSLLEQGYFLLDVSNMRLQEEGIGPTWSVGTTLYYCNLTTGSGWNKSVSSSSEGLSVEEKTIIRELRQSNIFCFKLTGADTDVLQLSYSDDNTKNTNHYYKTATYKAGDLKGKMYAYLTSYTVKSGSNMGKKAYMIGQVSLPEVTPKAEVTKEPEEEEPKEEKSEEEESEENVVEENAILANSTSGNTVTIRVNHDFDGGGAEAILHKISGETEAISIGTGIGSFVYDCDAYDYFFIQKYKLEGGEGNRTVAVSTAEIMAKKNIYGSYITVTPGGWTGQQRSVSYGTSIYIKQEFKNGATVCYTLNGTVVSETAVSSDSIIIFDVNSTAYDGFFIRETKTDTGSTNVLEGNKTEILTRDKIKTALGETNTMLKAKVGGWIGETTKRTLKLLEPGTSISDMSLNIPEGTFKKKDDIFYVKSTFYDYYSDVEMEGSNRNTLSGAFDNTNGGADKVQAKKFNAAIEEYFKNTSLATSSWQAPLYFGDFYAWRDGGYSLLNFRGVNNNGTPNMVNGANGACLGLVNSKLVDNNLMMGTDNNGVGVEVPYFNEEFLRGNNSLNDNIGYVFENVLFPFVKNSSTGYWEFDSYASDQTLRMKQTAAGKYFLDQVGASNAVKGYTSSAVTAKSNFFPFNDASESGNPKRLNYAFGAKLEIPFYMTADGKVKLDENTSKDITFEFQGDDDVWIFIDDTLVLDIGGDHGAVKGSINFAECTAETTGWRNGTSGREAGTFTTNFSRLSSTEQHTLTMFYMERGIWESNMYLSFNFPKTNNLEVEKEIVTTDADGNSFVNAAFAEAMENLKTNISFPVTIKNMATSGDPFDVQVGSAAINLNFDEITSKTSASLYHKVQGTTLEKITSNIPGNTPRTCVLKYRYPGEKQYTDGQSVTDDRSILINYPDAASLSLTQTQADRIKEKGYIELEAYLEATTGAGSPFVALIDGNGNRIGTWANENAVAGTNGRLQANNWVKLRVYISQMKSMARLGTATVGTFDFTNIKSLQFAYWDNKTVYIDNITLNAPAIYTEEGGFERDQGTIPDYGSIGATVSDYKLMPITGAKYNLGGTDNYVDSGTIYLKNAQLALFSDQFRRNSYLSINEQCDTGVFDVAWTLSQSGVVMKSGTGTAVEDGRTAENTDPSGIAKPDANTILFRTWDEEANATEFYGLNVKFTNTIKTGSLKIKKQVKTGQDELIDVELPYTLKVTFSNIAGLSLEGSLDNYESMDKEIFLESNKDVFEITGIPAGTEYRIEEVRTAGADFPLQEEGKIRDDFSLVTMTGAGNDAEAGSYYDEEGQCYRGTIIADASGEITDVVSVVNDINPLMDAIGGQKIWALGGQNSHLGTAPEAQSVTLKLQRKFVQTDEDITNNVAYSFTDVTEKDTGNPVEIVLNNKQSSKEMTCSDGNIITITTDTDWKYSVSGLPLYGKTESGRKRKYEYRFVETKIVTKTGETVVERKTDDSGYKENSSGYTVTGGTQNITTSAGEELIDYNLTNTYDPMTNLQITKVSGDDNPKKMGGVTFKLERLIKDGNGHLTVDTAFNGGKGYWEATTGEGTGMITFLNLTDGNYRLTEIKTVSGYSLLAKPIELVISRADGTTVEDTEYELESDGKTIAVTISNQGLLELPFTGSNGRKYIIGLGIVLAVGGEGFYLWNMYYQSRKRRRQRRQ